MSDAHEAYGKTIAGSRWFNGEPNIVTRPVKPVFRIWLCPIDECGGEMNANGGEWSCWPPGYHHTCNLCGFTAAPRGGQRYPSIAYEPLAEPENGG